MNLGLYPFARNVFPALMSTLLACFALLIAAQPVQSAERSAAPDGAPTLPRETVITEKTLPPGDDASGASRSVIQSESRVQGQLASARVSSGANAGYIIVDPSVGRADRAASNGRRRVTPSQWELLRF